MTLVVTWQEEEPSRAYNLSQESASQDINFFVYGNFTESATVDPDFGPNDDRLVLEAAYDFIPLYRTFSRYSGIVNLLRLDTVNIERAVNNVWRVKCTYTLPPINPDEQGDPNKDDYQKWTENFVQLGFNVGSQQENVKMSLLTRSCQKNFGVAGNVPYPANKPAPMGLTLDGAEGSSVYKRAFSFNITSYFTPSQLNFQYVRRLFRLATTVNDDTFCGFPAGSVLFLEASASGDVYSEVPVTFDFHMQPNFKFTQAGAEALMDPDEDDPIKMYDVYKDPWFPDSPTDPTDASYSGWDVVDYMYEAQNANGAGLIVQVPTLRTIHTVYFAGDFSKFNI